MVPSVNERISENFRSFSIIILNKLYRNTIILLSRYFSLKISEQELFFNRGITNSSKSSLFLAKRGIHYEPVFSNLYINIMYYVKKHITNFHARTVRSNRIWARKIWTSIHSTQNNVDIISPLTRHQYTWNIPYMYFSYIVTCISNSKPQNCFVPSLLKKWARFWYLDAWENMCRDITFDHDE